MWQLYLRADSHGDYVGARCASGDTSVPRSGRGRVSLAPDDARAGLDPLARLSIQPVPPTVSPSTLRVG